MKYAFQALWLLATLLAARAQTKIEPARIDSVRVAERELAAEAAGFAGLVQEAQWQASLVRTAITAHDEQQAITAGLLGRRANIQSRLRQLQNHEDTLALTIGLPPVIAAAEESLARKKELRTALDADIGGDEAENRRLLAAMKSQLAAARRDLPAMRPGFVPAGMAVRDYQPILAREAADFEPQVGQAEAELARRAQARAAAIAEAERAALRAVDSRLRYYALHFEARDRLFPAYVAELKVRAPADPDSVYYHAVIDEVAANNAQNTIIRSLVAQLPVVERRLAAARADGDKAAQTFLGVSNRWQARNADYQDLINSEAYLNIVLELVDSAASIAADGGGPVAFLFETGARAVDLRGDWSKFRIADATLSDELLAYRQRVANELAPDRAGGSLLRRPNGEVLGTAESVRRQADKERTVSVTLGDVGKDIGWGFVKDSVGEAVSDPFGEICFKIAEKHAAAKTLFNADVVMFAQELCLGKRVLDFAEYELVGTETRVAAETIGQMFRRAVTHSGTDYLERLRAKPPGGLGFAGGALLSANIAMAKGLIRNASGLAQERQRAMNDMAYLDIEWFVRRADFVAAMDVVRRAERQLISYRAKIGELYAANVEAPARSKRVLVNRPVATIGEQLRVELRFNRLVRDVSATIGRDSSYTSSQDATEGLAFSVPLYGRVLALGKEPVRLFARSAAAHFDANPLTVVRYRGPTLERPAPVPQPWENLEPAPDALHEIETAAPTIALADPAGGKPYIPGDWVGVAYRLPGSLPHQHLRLQLDDGETEISLSNRAEDRAQLLLRRVEDSIALRIVRAVRGEPPLRIAQLSLSIREPATRVLSGGPMRISQEDLPTRGIWQEPSTRPIAPGDGRFLFERRDAASQYIGPVVYVTLPGAQETLRQTWSTELDMAPGRYDVTVFASPNHLVPGQVIKAGEVTRVSTGGYGRLTIRAPNGKHGRVSLYAPGTTDAKHRTWDSTMDVQPGVYDLGVYFTGGEATQAGVPITAGKVTIVDVGGSR